MEPLNEYITGRIRIDNIKPKFPINGTLNDIINFLESNGFKESPFKSGRDIFPLFNGKSTKQYILNRDIYNRLWFADTSNGPISGNNPIFYIKSDTHNKKSTQHEFSCFNNNDYGSGSVNLISQQEFANDLNKYFGWEV